jgi:hypothetical protein
VCYLKGFGNTCRRASRFCLVTADIKMLAIPTLEYSINAHFRERYYNAKNCVFKLNYASILSDNLERAGNLTNQFASVTLRGRSRCVIGKDTLQTARACFLYSCIVHLRVITRCQCVRKCSQISSFKANYLKK